MKDEYIINNPVSNNIHAIIYIIFFAKNNNVLEIHGQFCEVYEP